MKNKRAKAGLIRRTSTCLGCTRLYLIGVLVVMALSLAGCGQLSTILTGSSAPAVVKMGQTAPEISLVKLDGGQASAERVALSSLRGHPIIINFWATWCGPCRAEFPALQAKYAQYKDPLGLVVLSIDMREDAGAAEAQKFADQMGATFPIVLDTEGTAAALYRVQGLPTSIFVDRKGVVQDIVLGGPLTEEAIENRLAKIK